MGSPVLALSYCLSPTPRVRSDGVGCRAPDGLGRAHAVGERGGRSGGGHAPGGEVRVRGQGWWGSEGWWRGDRYGLHHLETEDMMNDMERPKVEVHFGGKMMVLVNQASIELL